MYHSSNEFHTEERGLVLVLFGMLALNERTKQFHVQIAHLMTCITPMRGSYDCKVA